MTQARGLLVLAAAMVLSQGAVADTAADARYCAQLIKLYRTYVNNPDDPRPTFSVPNVTDEASIAQCVAGNPAAGIPGLESVLLKNKLTLPRRGEG
jgi:hypothetical protein